MFSSSYKFIVSTSINPSDEALYNADKIVEWDSVQAVIALPHGTAYDDEICPICLGPSVVPVIIKCGHIFW